MLFDVIGGRILVDRNLRILADENFVESIREHARWQDDQCECLEERGLLLLAGSARFPFPYQNCVVRIDPGISAQHVLDRARDFFGSRGRGFLLIVNTGHDQDLDSLCQARGLKLQSDTPCMSINEPFQSIDLPDTIRAESFKEERHVRDAIFINSQAYQVYGAPQETIKATYGYPSKLLSSDKVAGHVLYRGNRPVATALTIFSGNGAGIYWVGTAPEAQRSGLGTICTRLATNEGFHHGASAVTLQASPYGEPLYLRLGYKTYDRLKWYSHRKPS
jgi:ribosomal protein S18 acetylase RimI-like enzyme